MEYPFVAMKRCLAKIVVFLLPGAIMNIAVAWGCAKILDIRKSSITTVYRFLDPGESQTEELLFVRRWSKPGAIHIYSLRDMPRHGIGSEALQGVPELLVPNWARPQLLPWQSDRTAQLDDIRCRVVDARGWPLLSFWCVWGDMVPGFSVDSPTEGGIRLPERWTSEHDRQFLRPTTLPFRPIWPGFAINTVFYAAVLWLLSLAPFTLRRAIRRKRGRCINCGYDLRGTAQMICSECGYEVRAEAGT